MRPKAVNYITPGEERPCASRRPPSVWPCPCFCWRLRLLRRTQTRTLPPSPGDLRTLAEGATAITYDENVPTEPPSSHHHPDRLRPEIMLSVTGLVGDRDYGAHLHTNPCGETRKTRAPTTRTSSPRPLHARPRLRQPGERGVAGLPHRRGRPRPLADISVVAAPRRRSQLGGDPRGTHPDRSRACGHRGRNPRLRHYPPVTADSRQAAPPVTGEARSWR